MNALHEYSLLVVVATPVLAFVVANVALLIAGGTAPFSTPRSAT